jgi:hypothetical protein
MFFDTGVGTNNVLIMKKILFLVAIAAGTAACVTEHFDVAPGTGISAGSFAPVAIDDAVDRMYSLMEAAYGPETRAATRTIAGISSFAAPASATRGGEPAPNGPDQGEAARRLAWVVNFAEGGFAVLGAHGGLPEVLCFTENGLFEEGEVEELAGELTAPEASVVPTDMIGSADPIRFIKKEVLAYALAADEEAALNARSPWSRQNARAVDDYGTWSAWGDFAQSGPLLATLWNQSFPYNKDCPPDPQNAAQTSYTGCVATALVQIIAHNEKTAPTSIKGDAQTSWADIKAHYYNPSKTALRSSTDLAIENDLAGITHAIGQGVDMNYSYYSGSAASSGKAESYLKNSNIDYKRVRRQIWYNATYITDMLEAGKPVYISAAGDGGAHAWVIDGSVHQKRTRTDGAGVTHTERRFMLHCNFGWGGTANGYYYSRTFTPNSGPVDTEPGHDASRPGSNGRNYNRQYQIIQYDL